MEIELRGAKKDEMCFVRRFQSHTHTFSFGICAGIERHPMGYYGQPVSKNNVAKAILIESQHNNNK